MSTLSNIDEQINYLLDYVKCVNKEQYEAMKDYLNDKKKSEKKEFIESIKKNGLFLHQQPFWDNINFDQLKALYNKYDWIEPYKCYVNGKEIQNRLVIAPMYMIRLDIRAARMF